MINGERLIEDILTEAFEKFEQYKEKWCELNNFSLNINSYQHEHYQLFYLLKYFPAYLAEYYLIYRNFFEKYGSDLRKLNILSLGCGVGIDYYSLLLYCSEHSISLETKYTGVDAINWLFPQKEFPFLHKNITEVDDDLFRDINIISLPKILTELSNNELSYIADKLSTSSPAKIYFLNSYITDNAADSSRVDGISQFRQICRYMTEYGYLIKPQCDIYTYYPKAEGINNLCSFFKYPDNILKKLTNIQKQCRTPKTMCNNCKINKHPILTAKYFAFNVFKFERL